MTWLKELGETYDVYSHLAGVVKDEQPVLLPIAHSTFNAQIEVDLDEEGNFIDSRKVEKGDAVTVIPVTEDSAARANGNFPHPLCDKLCYVAGDYSAYTGDQKEEYFESYIQQLKEWADSEDSYYMVKAIYQYLIQGALIQDLVRTHSLELNEDGKLTDEIKMQNQGQTGANVRFRVYGKGRNEETAVWKNHTMYQQFITFYSKKAGVPGLCYASGEIIPCTLKHPSKIRNTGDKSKIISGNDDNGFTYRGRFLSKDQAVLVGYELSQKSHNALRWLIQKQGYTRDESAIVCWMTNRDMQVPDPMKDSVNAYGNIKEIDLNDLLSPKETAPEESDSGMYFAKKFRNAVKGYASKLQENDKIAVIALEAATAGRLSIVYYDVVGAKQYMDAIMEWQEHCKWRRTIRLENKEEKRTITLESTPSPREMALAAYGVQRSEWLEADSKLLRATTKRLLPCITRKEMKIPSDLIKAAARRASMPESMSDFVWRNDVLSVVCAMIRYNYEEGEEKMGTFLEDNSNNRDVLFGRLLAVLDYKEKRAMFERDENGKIQDVRTTNAKRYWNTFSSRPSKTYKTIKENLNSYERKLSGFEQKKFDDWEGQIVNAIHACGGYNNRPLTEYYLPGYYQQMEYMKEEMQRNYTKNEQ